MDIIVICETSGVIREALRSRGHNAFSMDILPAKDGSPHHFQMNMYDFKGWDMFQGMVYHPTCTYLTISAEWAYKDPDYERYPGVGYHQKVKDETLVGAARREAREKAIKEAVWGMDLPIECKVMENPIGVLSTRYRGPDIVLQPHYFGDDGSKGTCLWIENLPVPQIPAAHLHHPGRMVEWPKGSGIMKRRWANQTDSGQNRLSPDDDRWDARSKTYPGIGNAIADLFPTKQRIAA